MKIYCTSKNTGPSYSSDPTHVKYIGSSLRDAISAVGDLQKYRRDIPEFTEGYIPTALPSEMKLKTIAYYMADGWWSSIVEFELEPTSALENDLDERELKGLSNSKNDFTALNRIIMNKDNSKLEHTLRRES